MTYENMKIEINNRNRFEDVVFELERLGYKKIGWIGYKNTHFITCNTKGFFTDHVVSLISCFSSMETTTIQQLREMK